MNSPMIEHSRQSLVDAIEKLRVAGYRITSLRTDLLRLLIETSGSITAAEALNKLRVNHPRASIDSVYRNLFTLTTCGLVDQINLQSREAARFEFQREHHHHAICLGCSTVVCIDTCPSNLSEALTEVPGFAATNHVFEVYGYCIECQDSQQHPGTP